MWQLQALLHNLHHASSAGWGMWLLRCRGAYSLTRLSLTGSTVATLFVAIWLVATADAAARRWCARRRRGRRFGRSWLWRGEEWAPETLACANTRLCGVRMPCNGQQHSDLVHGRWTCGSAGAPEAMRGSTKRLEQRRRIEIGLAVGPNNEATQARL